MSDLGDSISESIKKSQSQNPNPPNKTDDVARQIAWTDRIKKLLGYGNRPADDSKTE